MQKPKLEQTQSRQAQERKGHAMKLQTDEIVVVAREGGDERHATLFSCSQCESRAFIVYAVHGDTEQHLHLQCTTCGTTYCQGKGKCDE
jgi:hypothetical protein